VIAPSIPSGRILPSLVETTPVAGQAGAQSRSYGGAALAGHATQVAVDGAVARQLDEHTYSVEGLEASVAAILRLKQPTTSDLSVEKPGRPKSEKRTRRPAEKQEELGNVPRTSADGCEPVPVSSTSGLPPVGKPSSTTRTSRILDRYVFRDERGPGESWKRRIEARRERRA
jgi:hypothetical protein